MNRFEIDPDSRVFKLEVQRNDRWSIHRRLVELGIDAICDPEGHLLVLIKEALDITQIRSVIQSFTDSPEELRQSLESCWKLPFATHP